jgi:hypothetical protein
MNIRAAQAGHAEASRTAGRSRRPSRLTSHVHPRRFGGSLSSAFLLPHFEQGTTDPEDWILARPPDLRDGIHIAVVFFHRAPAFVIAAIGRIGANSNERLAGRQALMTGAGRKDYGITRFELDDATFVAPKTHGCAAPSDTQYFVNARVVVEIIVDAVASGIAPAVDFKQRFPDCRRVERVREFHRAPVHRHGPRGIVWNEAIVAEAERRDPPRSQQRRQLIGRRTPPAGSPVAPRPSRLTGRHNAPCQCLPSCPRTGTPAWLMSQRISLQPCD